MASEYLYYYDYDYDYDYRYYRHLACHGRGRYGKKRRTKWRVPQRTGLSKLDYGTCEAEVCMYYDLFFFFF